MRFRWNSGSGPNDHFWAIVNPVIPASGRIGPLGESVSIGWAWRVRRFRATVSLSWRDSEDAEYQPFGGNGIYDWYKGEHIVYSPGGIDTFAPRQTNEAEYIDPSTGRLNLLEVNDGGIAFSFSMQFMQGEQPFYGSFGLIYIAIAASFNAPTPNGSLTLSGDTAQSALLILDSGILGGSAATLPLFMTFIDPELAFGTSWAGTVTITPSLFWQYARINGTEPIYHALTGAQLRDPFLYQDPAS